ncbi:MAG: Na+/H+ antiporter NhaA [Bacteroidetes bacterium GWD2_45_23]|nr:MAG: Na+/H+ antiporter NhaA [Bacteroidetes bacterium GWC2_46_850]OFX83753.1 MAG: Na+/H+ antiporter NhaA [Bacteroidetes bacterium GWD2_45_23]
MIHDTRSLGVLLILCTVVSLLLTNMEATGARYVNFWETVIPGFHQLHLPHTIVHFINDALMSLFFFYVAIDIKREATSGELSSPRRMMFPAVSALFGVAVPALIFILFTVGTVGSRGWAIPSATDIAFTLGIISLLGKAVPHSMKVFLTALAIIDDLCAILIIALFYGSALHIVWLVAVALLGVVIFIVNRHLQNKMGTFLMILLGLGMWYSMYRSGIHASFAGVILAFLLPTQKLGTFERKLTFPVNFIVIPIFALANTSIVVSSAAITGLSSPLSIGIILGLFVGKPLGITIAVYLMTKFRLVRLGESVNLLQFIGVGILAGIGFTMSIFVSILAFPDDEILRDIAKLSVLIASTLAMIVGYLWLKVISKVKEKNNPDS